MMKWHWNPRKRPPIPIAIFIILSGPLLKMQSTPWLPKRGLSRHDCLPRNVENNLPDVLLFLLPELVPKDSRIVPGDKLRPLKMSGQDRDTFSTSHISRNPTSNGEGAANKPDYSNIPSDERRLNLGDYVTELDGAEPGIPGGITTIVILTAVSARL